MRFSIETDLLDNFYEAFSVHVRFAMNIHCPLCFVDTSAYVSSLRLGGH